ncbi:MAG: macrod1 [Gammaproteobacteria bacterium]|jgi:O-acetyl-ADP-ribose deacetylase (regulator of RNase III)|nr:macrod1 [Gammaproteobacteria bacterium]
MRGYQYKNIDLKFDPEGALDHAKGEAKNYALVNAANCTLLGTKGIAGAIQKQAGKQLVKELETEKGCKVTENLLTQAYGLGSNGFTHIIHAVGPDFREEKHGFTKTERDPKKQFRLTNGESAQDALNLTYLNIIKTANDNGITEIACPIVSGGKFKGKRLSEDDLAKMTIKAIRYANENIKLDSKITLVLCTFEKGKQGYLASLQKYNQYEDLEQISANEKEGKGRF